MVFFTPLCKIGWLDLHANLLQYLHKRPNLKIIIIVVEYLKFPTEWNELKFSDQTELNKNSKVNARIYHLI